MSELRVLTISTIILLIIGGVLPLVLSSFVDNSEVQLTGLRLTTYNTLSSGVDLTGSFDIPTDDSFYDYLVGVEVIVTEFPLFNAFLYIYLFILLYTIVKALPFT